MLSVLKLRNIALIKKQDIEFKNGLNVLTGETGAGKSMIIDSIGFLLGNKTDKNLIRKGETNAKVEGYFVDIESDELKEYFSNNDLEFDGTILISRSMNTDGKTENRINGEIVTANMIKEIAPYLTDIYGQSEQQNILSKKYQLSILDDFCKNDICELLKNYSEEYAKLKHINSDLLELGSNEQTRNTEIDICEYQINEIENAKMIYGEYESLVNERRALINGEKISDALSQTNEFLGNDSQNSCLINLSRSISQLSNVCVYDNELQSFNERLESAKIELNDIYQSLVDYEKRLDFDEDRLNFIDERLNLLKKLFSKYGKDYDEVMQFLDKTKSRYNFLTNAKEAFDTLTIKKTTTIQTMYQLAQKISVIRKKASLVLCKNICEALNELNMKNVQMFYDFNDNVDCNENIFNSNGIDNVSIMFSANIGQPPMPIAKIISGGEMSRFMLALKSVISNLELEKKTLIFDEIDTGISGETAQIVANKMAIISKKHQIISISHLFQITAMADHHYYIQKMENEGNTISTISELDQDGSVLALAKMLQGNANMAIAVNHAKTLKENALEFKKTIM